MNVDSNKMTMLWRSFFISSQMKTIQAFSDIPEQNNKNISQLQMTFIFSFPHFLLFFFLVSNK